MPRRILLAAAVFSLALLAPAGARAVDLNQCANGPADAPASCVGAAWVSTPITPADSHYLEGDSVPYTAELHDLRTSGSHTIELEYDTTEGSGRHAFDYLTSYDRTETSAVPCHDATICTGAADDTFPIPADPSLELAVPAVAQIAGSFAIWNGDITNVAYVRGPAAGPSSPDGPGLVTAVRITFTVDSPNALIAFGGHLASPLDWGVGNTAGAVTGAPYNMRAVAQNNLSLNVTRSVAGSPLPLGEPDVVLPPPPPPSPPPPPVFLPPQSTPVLGETVDVAPVKGEVLVRLKGKPKFVPLKRQRRIPVGSTVDARNGSAKLTSATNRRGGVQTATFYRGTFTVLQRGGALTTIELAGGDFDTCETTQARRAPAGAQSAAKAVQSLWGTGKGKFRTRGRYSSATVRGTVWFVQDRCDGTFTRVRTGTVEVFDFGRNETVTLNAGDTYLAERPG